MMDKTTQDLLQPVMEYYSAKLAEHGPTARGVDWNSEESQALRFRQLCRIIRADGGDFSINDLGCGYGALLDYLEAHHASFSYAGVDIATDMVEAARVRCAGKPHASFAVGGEPARPADYGVASGIFNVRLGHGTAEWLAHVERALDALDRTSRSGFAFNCLTSYSDADRQRDYLYYADPCVLFDLCKRRYSRHVALLHDYGLYEFTILVRKEP